MRHKLPYLFGVNLHQAWRSVSAGKPVRCVRSTTLPPSYWRNRRRSRAQHDARRGHHSGTGVGSAFAVDGQVITEGPGVPPGGEIWNLPFEGGIVEDLVSTRAIQGIYLKRTGKLTEVAAIAAAAVGDPEAAETFEDFGRSLGTAMRILLPAFTPDGVVLGGGISRSAHFFFQRPCDRWRAWISRCRSPSGSIMLLWSAPASLGSLAQMAHHHTPMRQTGTPMPYRKHHCALRMGLQPWTLFG